MNAQQKRREKVMASALRDFETFDFDRTCSICGKTTNFPVADLVPRFGSLPMAEVTARFRCRLPVCGGRPSLLTLRRGGYPIPLVGPGGYG